MDTIIKADCENCGTAKNACVKYHDVENWNTDDGYVSGSVTRRVIQCRGCDRVSYHISETCSEDINHFYDPITGEEDAELHETVSIYPPIFLYKKPEWSPSLIKYNDNLDGLYDELYLALNSGAKVLAAIGIRTCFDCVTEALGIPPELSFQKKLDGLRDNHHISQGSRDQLGDLVEAGSAAAHRGWKPTKKQIDILLDNLNALIYQSIVLPERHKRDIGIIPKRT